MIKLADLFMQMKAMHPNLGNDFEEMLRRARLEAISAHAFERLKNRIMAISFFLKTFVEADRQDTIKSVLEADDWRRTIKDLCDSYRSESKSFVTMVADWFNQSDSLIEEVKRFHSTTTDPQFLASVHDIVKDEPLLQPAVDEAIHMAQAHFRKVVLKLSTKFVHRVQHIRETACKEQNGREVAHREAEQKKVARQQFIREIEKSSRIGDPSCVIIQINVFRLLAQLCGIRSLVVFDSLEVRTSRWSYGYSPNSTFQAISLT
jgi:hypothetical protein